MKNPFTIRVVSSLVGATPKMWSAVLADRDSEMPHGAITYGPAYRVLNALVRYRHRAPEHLAKLVDPTGQSERVVSFRKKAETHARWFHKDVCPLIQEIVQDLGGDRQRSGEDFEVEGCLLSGGPHWLVIWVDGSQRLVYIVGPDWSRKRIGALLVLLQMCAMARYKMVPQSVVIIDLQRHEIITSQPRDPNGEVAVKETVRLLRRRWRPMRPSA